MKKAKQKLKIKNIILCLFIFSFSLLIFTLSEANAAELYLEFPEKEYGVGDIVPVDIKIDTEMELVNAVSASLFLDNTFFFEGFSNGGSLINFWVEEPNVDSKNNISFSGLVPGGILSEDGLLTTVFLKAQKEGTRMISFGENSKVLLADGKGTEANLRLKNYKLRIMDEIQNSKFIIPDSFEDDNYPPEPFIPQMGRDKSMFSNKWFLVFATQDKDSGIDYYEVLESKVEIKKDFEGWARAKSPYILKDQSRKSYVYVRAIDKAGNERVEMVKPKKSTSWSEFWWIYVIIITTITFLLLRKKVRA